MGIELNCTAAQSFHTFGFSSLLAGVGEGGGYVNHSSGVRTRILVVIKIPIEVSSTIGGPSGVRRRQKWASSNRTIMTFCCAGMECFRESELLPDCFLMLLRLNYTNFPFYYCRKFVGCRKQMT